MQSQKKAVYDRAIYSNILKTLPSVESILIDPSFLEFQNKFSREFIAYSIRKQIGDIREYIKKGIYPEISAKETLRENVIKRARDYLVETETGPLISAVNATGVILHTGLGRAPLSSDSVLSLQNISTGYSTLEIDRETGRRGSRTKVLEDVLCYLCKAEAAAVVNNNAAAVMIVLNSLANDREVIISRGELVEIGGSFRMPDIMASSGTRMIEVGTTNKTRLSDYTKAVKKNTGAILKVHSSNYKVLGFSESVSISSLSGCFRKKKIPVIYDLGGGIVFDLQSFGLPHEPVVAHLIRDGADVVTFSGDKVLGGPQAGIIIGKRKYISKIKKNPFARALRCDKLVLAALHGTLMAYLKGIDGFKSLPSAKMLLEKPAAIKKRAQQVKDRLPPGTRKTIIDIEPCESEVGSGALPLEQLPSYAVTFHSTETSPEKIAGMLRMYAPPVFGYIKHNKVYLDMRTVFKSQIGDVVECIASVQKQLAQ
jgi:L-seryl-tRNA(Ser) seleniumtransferase